MVDLTDHEVEVAYGVFERVNKILGSSYLPKRGVMRQGVKQGNYGMLDGASDVGLETHIRNRVGDISAERGVSPGNVDGYSKDWM